MRECSKCKKQYEDNVTYCQNCGEKLTQKKAGKGVHDKNARLWAGFNMKGSSLAPLACMSNENVAEREFGKVSTIPDLAKVTPKEDGSWYCPDCGEHNAPYARNCKGCGRDFV